MRDCRKEDGEPPTQVDKFDAWESALSDFIEDTEASMKLYGNRALHFDAFADAGEHSHLATEPHPPQMSCDANVMRLLPCSI